LQILHPLHRLSSTDGNPGPSFNADKDYYVHTELPYHYRFQRTIHIVTASPCEEHLGSSLVALNKGGQPSQLLHRGHLIQSLATASS